MNAYFTMFTDGKPIRMSATIHSGRGDSAISVVTLFSGGMQASIHFESPEELLAFCEKHNIPVSDDRAANAGQPNAVETTA